MSGRSVPRFALAGLLAATLAAPGVAQERRFEVPLNSPLFQFRYTLPAAPMPRPKVHIGEIEIDLSFGTPMTPPQLPGTAAGTPPAANSNNGTVKWENDRTDPFNPFVVTGSVTSDAGLTGTIAADRPCCGADCCRKPVAAVPQVMFHDKHQCVLEFGEYCVPAPPGATLTKFVTAQPAAGMTGGPGCCRPAPAAVSAVAAMPAFGPLPQLQAFAFGNAYPLQLVVANEPTCPRTATNPLLGTWYRDMGVGVTAVTFTPDEMKLCLASRDGENAIAITVTAHYTITKDGLVYGAITGADVDAKLDDKTKSESGMELAELSLTLQELIDRPFSFRMKVTSAGLMVSQLKAGSGEHFRSQELAVLGGLYKFAKDGRVPAPTAPKLTEVVPPAAAPVAIGAPIAKPAVSEPIQRIGVDFNITAPPPRPVGRCDVVAAPSPVCNDATKSMAADAFTQMMRPAAGGMTLPSGRYLDHQPQYFAPDPAFPQPRELVCGQFQSLESAAPAKPGSLGTWYREIGSKRCVVKVEPTHLTITVSEAHDFDGQTVTGHLTVTADYHTTRDGLTAVGLITSVDAKFDGDLPDDEAETMPEKVAELQKALEEKPFAITFRRYGEALVIGNVRMPDVGDRMEFQLATYVGGRFKTVGEKSLPKLKAVKEGEPKPAPVYLPPPPPGVYGAPGRPGAYGYGPPPGVFGVPPQPGIYPPPVAAPPGDLLPPQAVPYPVPTRPAGLVLPAPTAQPVEETPSAPMVAPTTPVMPMSAPTPPTDSSAQKKGVKATEMAIGWRNRIANLPDPARNGAMSVGLSGQLFLFGGPKMKFALADGTLTVDLIDETPRPAGQPAATPERWQIDKATLRKLVTTDETFGKSYVLFLPWPAYKPDVTKVRISARYDSDNGQTLFAIPSTFSIDVQPTPADSSAETPSAQANEKAVGPTTKPAKKPKKMMPSSDPTTRVQKVFDQSEALKWIRDDATPLQPEFTPYPFEDLKRIWDEAAPRHIDRGLSMNFGPREFGASL